MSHGLRINGGSALVDGAFVDTAIDVDHGHIAAIGAERGAGRTLDAQGLLVLPGIVDIHGDAFERQLMPRPGVHFPAAVGLKDSDRQAIANGITTVFHGVTASWEPGLRSIDNARAIVDQVARLKGELAADTRLHLRYETFNLEAEAEIAEWLAARRIDMLGFNDHMIWENTPPRVRKIAQMAERAGISVEDFAALVERLRGRADEVPPSTERLAAAARENGVPMLSHDDRSPEQRRWFRALDCRVAEFPTTHAAARASKESGMSVLMGAPNVVRGGSHSGNVSARELVEAGHLDIISSDYIPASMMQSAFFLADVLDGISLPQAIRLVSKNPAQAVGLDDRGEIAEGKRADLVRLQVADHVPIIKTVWREGRRVI